VIVVDTSVWIDFFRGRQPTAAKLVELLDSDDVALPVPVRLEILGGARKNETERLGRVLGALPLFAPTDATWQRIESWFVKGGAAGQRFGIGDLIVAGIAAENDCAVWSLDDDFSRMARLGFVTLFEDT
jgi:tRNA(fMet)-specific endonuclease VapC